MVSGAHGELRPAGNQDRTSTNTPFVRQAECGGEDLVFFIPGSWLSCTRKTLLSGFNLDMS